MLKRNFLFTLVALTSAYSLGQKLEYACKEELCTRAIKQDKNSWVSKNLSPKFGEKIAEGDNFYLQTMTFEDHKKNFKRCYDTTQSFLLCYDDLAGAQAIESYKKMGFEEGSRLYGMALYLFDQFYAKCGSIAHRFAIYQKEPQAFMGYIEFSAAKQDGDSEIQIYLLPEFRSKGYGFNSMKLALDYMSQHLNSKSKDLSDGDIASQIVNKIVSTVAEAREFFSPKGSKTFGAEAVKTIELACKLEKLRDAIPNALFKKFSARIRKTNTHSAELFKSLGFCLSSSNTIDNYYEKPCEIH